MTGASTSASAAHAYGKPLVGAEAFTLSGTGVGGAGALRSVSGDNSLAGAITLGAAQTWNVGAGRTLTLGGSAAVNKATYLLRGRQVVAVMNFPPKRIAGFRSEVLVLGVVVEDDDVVLLQPDQDVPPGKPIA